MTLKSRVLFQSPAAPRTADSTTVSRSIDIATPTQQTPTPSESSGVRNTSPSTSLEDGDADDDPIETNEFERLSETITKLQNASQANAMCAVAKKSVAFVQDDYNDEDIENRYADLKSRHKSEPDLSNILQSSNTNRTEAIVNQTNLLQIGHQIGGGTGGRYIANKLLKGLSMVNLMSPDTSPLVHQSAKEPFTPVERNAAVARRGSIDVNERTPLNRIHTQPTFDEDIDDPDFVATPNSQRTSSRRNSDIDEFDDAVHTPLGEQRQRQHLMGRRSMSPITKSTQRMSKAMQVTNFYLTLSC